MREEYNSVLSTRTDADKISHFGRYRYIGKSQMLAADISVSIQKYAWNCVQPPHNLNFVS